MNDWQDLIIGSEVVASELKVFVNLVGAMFLLEIATQISAFLGGIKR